MLFLSCFSCLYNIKWCSTDSWPSSQSGTRSPFQKAYLALDFSSFSTFLILMRKLFFFFFFLVLLHCVTSWSIWASRKQPQKARMTYAVQGLYILMVQKWALLTRWKEYLCCRMYCSVVLPKAQGHLLKPVSRQEWLQQELVLLSLH